jgi:nucleoid-associated protein YgaU
MARIKNSSIIIFTIITAFMFMACRLEVPVREMTQAKKDITAAMKVKADKYAPEELNAAKTKLFESQAQVSDKKTDDAKKSADEADMLALSAINKALPLLAKDTIGIAEKSLDEAGEAYAEQLAPAQYRDAEGKLKQANDLFQEKKYQESYEMALKADASAKNARNVALGKRDILRDSITEVKATLDEAEKYGAKKYAADKFNLAGENILIAERAYQDQDLKKGFSAVEVAKMNADEALLASLKGYANDRIAKAGEVIGQAEKSKKAAGKKADIDAAKEALSDAKAKLADAKYKESIEASDEAIRLAYAAMGKNPDGTDIASGTEGGHGTEGQQVEEDKDFWFYKVVYRQHYKDCLWYVAKKYYNNGLQWKKIYEANKDQIKNPDLVFPGQVLKVPKPVK